MKTKRIRCLRCGKAVSTKIPFDTVIRAWIECPECVEKSEEKNISLKEKGVGKEKVWFCPRCHNPGFPSIYTLVTSDKRIGLCTTCANRLRFEKKCTVNRKTQEIYLKNADELT